MYAGWYQYICWSKMKKEKKENHQSERGANDRVNRQDRQKDEEKGVVSPINIRHGSLAKYTLVRIKGRSEMLFMVADEMKR